MSNTIKVHCINQEYWYIRKQKCEFCGGSFQKDWERKTMSGEDGDFDVHYINCRNCSRSISFKFDIAGFSPLSNTLITSKIRQEIEEMDKETLVWYIYTKIAGGPMENALKLIKDLGRAKDSLALDYLEDAINYMRNNNRIGS